MDSREVEVVESCHTSQSKSRSFNLTVGHDRNSLRPDAHSGPIVEDSVRVEKRLAPKPVPFYPPMSSLVGVTVNEGEQPTQVWLEVRRVCDVLQSLPKADPIYFGGDTPFNSQIAKERRGQIMECIQRDANLAQFVGSPDILLTPEPSLAIGDEQSVWQVTQLKSP